MMDALLTVLLLGALLAAAILFARLPQITGNAG
jgi:hypothetical protein